MKKYDVAVIGAGSGLNVVQPCVDRGQSVAIIEADRFGGTCANRGCIPSKMLIYAADIAEMITRGPEFGVHATLDRVDWPALQQQVWGRMDPGSEMNEKWHRDLPGVDVYKARATFVSDRVLELAVDGERERIEADDVVVAVGTRPSVPPIPGLSDVPYITSDEALRLPEIPRRLTVIGAGYIGAEIAHIFGSLGADVTIIGRGPQMLRNEDDAVSERFTEVFGRAHRLILNASFKSVSHTDGLFTVNVVAEGADHSIRSDALLVATGRRANSDGLNMGATGVETDPRGFVKVDPYMRTSVEGIWALGDIVPSHAFKHSANQEGRLVAHNIHHPDALKAMDYHATPHAVFASPQVAGVGMTEREVKAAGIPYDVSQRSYDTIAWGMASHETDGFAKVIRHAGSHEVLGAHIIGPHASIVIQQMVAAVRLKMTTDELARVVYAHPALPELIENAILDF